MSDIYQYLSQDLYALNDPTPSLSSAPGQTAQLSSASGETSSESIISGEIDGNIILSGGSIQSKNFVTGSAGWQLTPTSGEINFSLSVSSINIPNTTTANSFHVDSTGNAWWGANVATGYTGANAYILATGAAVFKNVQIGGTTIQYVITNSGIFSFGDGSDGDVTISVDTTLATDKYYDNLIVNSAAVLNTGGYRIFCKTSLTLSGNGVINRNGVAGHSGSTDSAGQGLADGYTKGCPTAGNGGATVGAGTPGNAGSAGTNVSNSLGSNAGAGGRGGDGTASGGGGGAGGTATTANVKLIANWHLATLLDVSSTGSTVKFTNSASGGGGGSGGGGSGGGGAGGGGGSGGGMVAIYAKSITINSGSSITANGGVGGDGAGGSGTGGGGGGGAGGNGGTVILVYNSLTNSGSVTVTGGTGGTHAGGASATNGGTGTAGVIYQFQLSL